MPHPLLLRADNFTSPTRTPWGGTRLLRDYKAGCPLAPEKAAYAVVGESWEISATPELPSRAAHDDAPLPDVLARDPEDWLGPETAARRGSTALLVKLLDAAEALSLQIHPSDEFEELASDESGKPESWYVLDAGTDAGLYLGLREGVSRRRMRDALERQEDVSRLLHFVPVRPGDFFAIEAGTPHAIGQGVTLVEPQRVLPGRRGVTYRYWDWNRRYDAGGHRDPQGTPRELHLREALAVTNWDAPRESAMLQRIRLRSGPPAVDAEPRLEILGGPEGPVRFAPLRVGRLTGRGAIALPAEPRLRGMTVVGGRVRIDGPGFDVEAGCGRSVVLPAGLDARVELDRAHAVVAAAD